MNKIKVATALALVFCLPISGTRSASAADYSVVPGRSVGKIRLGASRAAVLGNMGKPSKSVKWRSGPTQDTWLGKLPPNNRFGYPDVEQTFVNVIYRAGKVVQIEFNSPSFKTPSGISMRSSLAEFRAKYPNPRSRAYGYDDPNGGGYIGYYYDSVKKGIAFSFGVQDEFDARVTPRALRVHAPGKPVLPDPGGEPTAPTDEVPVRPEGQ